MVKNFKICGFIPAAGRGERLRPLTDGLPKPLLPVNGAKMIDAAITWFKRAGVMKIVVNGWYMREMLFDYVEAICRERGLEVFFSPEEELMGTGGGILQALRYVKEDILVVHNSDIITDLEPAVFLSNFTKNPFPAFLACVPYVHGTTPLWLTGDRLFFTEQSEGKAVTYAGISAFKTSVLHSLKVKKCDFVSGILKPLNEKYGGLGGYLHRGLWCDGGTPEGYRKFRDIWKKVGQKS